MISIQTFQTSFNKSAREKFNRISLGKDQILYSVVTLNSIQLSCFWGEQ